MKKVDIDMWYGDSIASCTSYSWQFYDLDREYRGNIYKNGVPVGDFCAESLQDFQHIFHNTRG